jgi:hypothetical protein
MSELEFDNQTKIKQSVSLTVETKIGNSFIIVKTAEAIVPLESALTSNIILRGTKLDRAVIVETEISIQKR